MKTFEIARCILSKNTLNVATIESQNGCCSDRKLLAVEQLDGPIQLLELLFREENN